MILDKNWNTKTQNNENKPILIYIDLKKLKRTQLGQILTKKHSM